MKRTFFLLTAFVILSLSAQSQKKYIDAFYRTKGNGQYICLNSNGLALVVFDEVGCFEMDYVGKYEMSNDTIIIDGELFGKELYLIKDDRLCWYNSWSTKEFSKKRHGLKLMTAKEIEKFSVRHKYELDNFKFRITNGVLEPIPNNEPEREAPKK